MKTQCPNCQSKFKAPDDSTGKKANCPKCNQPFIISPLIKDNIAVEEHSQPPICFFCQKVATSSWPAKTMYRILDSGGLFGKINAIMKQFGGGLGGLMADTIVTYETCQVRIPRCEQCKSAHEEQDEFEKKHGFKSFFGGSALPKGTKSLSDWTEFSEVKNLDKAGWELGEKPEEKYGYKYIKHEDAMK